MSQSSKAVFLSVSLELCVDQVQRLKEFTQGGHNIQPGWNKQADVIWAASSTKASQHRKLLITIFRKPSRHLKSPLPLPV